MKIGKYVVHPAALAWPDISPADLAELAESIRKSGQKEPIKLLRGEVVDGRCRLRACLEIGVEPVFAALPDDTDPWDYSLTVNWHRRHLLKSQFAAIAAECVLNSKAWAEECAQAAAAQAASRARKPEQNEAWATIAHDKAPNHTKERLAKKLGVSARTAQDLLTVREIDPAALDRVKRGEVSVSEAAREVRKQKKQPKPPLVDAPPPLLDAIDQPVPDDMRDAWTRAEIAAKSFAASLAATRRTWSVAEKELREIAERTGSVFLLRFVQRVDGAMNGADALKGIQSRIGNEAPYVVCWKCSGAGCNFCDKTGACPLSSKVAVERELGKKAAS